MPNVMVLQNHKAPQGGCGHRRQHAQLRQLSEVQKTRDLDLDWVKVTSTYTVYVGLPAYPTM